MAIVDLKIEAKHLHGGLFLKKNRMTKGCVSWLRSIISQGLAVTVIFGEKRRRYHLSEHGDFFKIDDNASERIRKHLKIEERDTLRFSFPEELNEDGSFTYFIEKISAPKMAIVDLKIEDKHLRRGLSLKKKRMTTACVSWLQSIIRQDLVMTVIFGEKRRPYKLLDHGQYIKINGNASNRIREHLKIKKRNTLRFSFPEEINEDGSFTYFIEKV